MNLLGWSERHSEHKTTLGCYPEDETRIKDGKERLELNRGSESRWTYRIRPIRFIHVRWTGVDALTCSVPTYGTCIYSKQRSGPLPSTLN